jgi:DNA-binding response OmpR family regulator
MSETVLVVDDSLTVRMDLAQAFTAAGFETVPCADASEARRLSQGRRISLIILDVILPDADGIDLLPELRARHPEAAILMLTTEAEVKDRIRGLQTGADDYVGKPYDTSYVVTRARELLRARKISQAPEGVLNVLVIDDSISFRESLRELLAGAGYAVSLASSGEEGLQMAALQRPHAVIVDGILPGIDGPTVIRRLRLDPALRRTPVLLLSGSDERGAELRALDAGADAFVRKGEDVDMILARLQAMIRGAGAAADDSATSLLGSKRILAVDDSPTYLNELSIALVGEGYDVVLARSGEEALELLAVQPVDCILLDLIMPGLSGTETCRRIKATPITRDIPLIMVTAMQEREAMIDALASGADDYIAKSAELEVLKARLRAQLRRKQFEDENRRMREELLQRDYEAAEARAAQALAEARAELTSELERKNRELEAFSYSVSHDLRAPLRSIDGFSQALLEDYAPQLDAEGRNHLNRIRSGAQRMGELIDDLLALSRVSRAELHSTRIDLGALAESVLAELRRNAPNRDVEVSVEPALMADADRRLMLVALENLLGNAWKFTGKRDGARIVVGKAQVEHESAFFVRDNGAGFDMRYSNKLFSPFQRLHSPDDFAGTGIGLATVYRVIDRHGGRVWAESAPGEGATFYFTLPVIRARLQ